MLYTSLFKKLTKYIVGFKSFIAALFYALMVFLLPVYYSSSISLAVVLMFAFYFLRIFISNAACDVKDIRSDKKRKLKTIAIRLGEKNALLFLNMVNLMSGALIIWGVAIGALSPLSLSLLATIPYASYYFYLYSKVGNKEMYTNAIVDGEFIFWLPSVVIGGLLI
jgi:4-hydroxybenzoate polyprenyltransferase